MKRTYFDYNATTPVDPEIKDLLHSQLADVFGNPSSIHEEGRKAKRVLDDAREGLASFLGCEDDEIVFTGSGSESNNLAIKGIAESLRDKGRHIITSAVEHPSVLKTFRHLESLGWDVTYLKVDRLGRINLDSLKSSITDNTVLLSLMFANNETGVIFPVKEAASIARERGFLVHTDAVQAVGKIKVNATDLGVDLLSLAGHKFYAPKGVGALYVRKGIKPAPQIIGGGQEFGFRAGTENLSGISSLAMAAKISQEKLEDENKRIAELSSILRKGIKKVTDEVSFNGDVNNSLLNTINVSFNGISGESLVMALDLEGFAISAGSACASGALSPSHVLTEMGLDDDDLMGAVRISLGRWNSEGEINAFLEVLPPILDRLKKNKA